MAQMFFLCLQLTESYMLLQCICSCPTAYANGPSMAPTMAPAAAPVAQSAPAAAPAAVSDPEDMSDAVDSCNKPVPTQYEAFVDVSGKACNQSVTKPANVFCWAGAVQCGCIWMRMLADFRLFVLCVA